jgi:hypothetical protein
MEKLTIYTVKAKTAPDIWVFKYHLNGVLASVEFLNVELSEKQINWLFLKGNFPYNETKIKHWQTLKANFEIKVNMPEITFDLFWKLYPYNALAKKKTALERWNKLSDANKIKIILKIPEYIKLKTKENQFFPYAEVFINGLWWDN